MISFLFKIANIARKIYWKIFKPKSVGVRVLVKKEESILLVKHHYCKSFYLPGGGVKKGEAPMEAARRELSEECGLFLKNFKLLGKYLNDYEGKKDDIFLFLAKTEREEGLKPGLEIESCNYFPLDLLPADLSPGTARRIEEYRNKKFNGGVW
ncbi:MAG: NUDIX domain-containing protein [Candidatus Paceibacterota bacterium]|jgi:8-oxo-dGTP pyrophosphatase MutT (NUDIX family)